VQIGDLVLEQQMEMVVARDVAGPAGARTHRPERFLHRGEDRWMLAHAEIIIRAPDGDLGTDPVIKGARKLAAAPLEVGEHAVPPFGAQRLQALSEEGFVIHCQHGHPDDRILTYPRGSARGDMSRRLWPYFFGVHI